MKQQDNNELGTTYVDEDGCFKHPLFEQYGVSGIFQWENNLEFFADILLDEDDDDEDYYDEY